MKVRLILVLSFALLSSMFVSAMAETLTQCTINCPPGNNSCTQCCSSQWENAGGGACSTACSTADSQCMVAVSNKCAKISDPNQQQQCYNSGSAACYNTFNSCWNGCGNTQIPGGCPGEVQPQKCPYNCQSWNPASQSCVGAPMNACGNAMAARAKIVAAEKAKLKAAAQAPKKK
jgi:hypothetical protein